MNLIIYILDEKSSLEEVVQLEQHFIDSLKPNLNVDLVASSSGYHSPMCQVIRDKLRKDRGIPVYLYSADDFTLLYVFLLTYPLFFFPFDTNFLLFYYYFSH